MKVPELNIIFRFIDFLLSPFMWILGGFTFPLQETHDWHTTKWKWKRKFELKINQADEKAIFTHGSPLGLFHMPIFGGLTKYVVIEAKGFKKYWHIGFKDEIQLLKIKQNRAMLLVGSNGTVAHGLGDNGKELKLKIVGFGELGDKKYNNLRLF